MRGVFIRSFGGTEEIQVGELGSDPKELGEEQVRVLTSSINMLDIHVRRGVYRDKVGSLPHVPGSDALVYWERGGGLFLVYPVISGRVGEENVDPGRLVMGRDLWGTQREWMRVPRGNLFEAPQHLTPEELGSLPLSLTTAHNCVAKYVKPGYRVLVTGVTGGVGHLAAQLASLLGTEVHGVSTTRSRKVAGVDVLKADEVKKDYYDLVIHSVGLLQPSLRALRSGGSLVLIGGSSEGLDLKDIYVKHLTVHGTTLGSSRDFMEGIKLVTEGKIRPLVDRVFPMDRIREAHEYFESGQKLGKIVIRVTDQ